MQTTTLPMLTIIAEEVLKERLIEDLKHAGVKGYTWTLVEGEGSRHMRAGEVPGQNVKLEVITTAEVTDRLLERLTKSYFPNYAVIAFVSQVQVVRGEKYV